MKRYTPDEQITFLTRLRDACDQAIAELQGDTRTVSESTLDEIDGASAGVIGAVVDP